MKAKQPKPSVKMINVRFSASTAGGRPFVATARIATGSERTVLRLDLAKLLALSWYPVSSLTMTMPDGGRVPCYEMPIILTVQGHSVAVIAAVPDDSTSTPTPRNLIGDDFLRATQAKLDCATGRLTFGIPPTPKRREFHVGGGLWTFGPKKAR